MSSATSTTSPRWPGTSEPRPTDDLKLTGSALTPGAQRSWWLREALAREAGAPCPPLARDTIADVVIVGGVFTGLWTAFHLKQQHPEVGVVVLEQDICGGGPSGRNGGFAIWQRADPAVIALPTAPPSHN